MYFFYVLYLFDTKKTFWLQEKQLRKLIENVFTNKKYKAYIGKRKKYFFSEKS